MARDDLTTVREVRVADVYKAGRLAARLTRADGGNRFEYLPEYLDEGPSAVATSLPLGDEHTFNAAGAVPAFFAGLLPEGGRLSSLRWAVKTSADDELSLLLAVGRDPVGDVQVVPAGGTPEPAEALVQVERSFDEIRFSDVLEAAGVVDPIALAGVQDKGSARMLSAPVGRANARYILKVDPPEFPHVVENEAFFLHVARRSRIPVASAEIVRDATGRTGLLVERFDRGVDAKGVPVSYPVEDAAQVLGIYPADKYAVTSEQVVAGLSEVCAARALAVRSAFHQFCLAWLTGNGDLHAKNISVLGTGTGEWRLAPAYDVPSTLAYGDHTLALSLDGRRSRISRRRLLTFAERVGLPEGAAIRTLDGVLAATADVKQQLTEGAIPFDARTVKDLVRRLQRRREDVLG